MGVLATAAVVKEAEMAVVTEAVVMEEARVVAGWVVGLEAAVREADWVEVAREEAMAAAGSEVLMVEVERVGARR